MAVPPVSSQGPGFFPSNQRQTGSVRQGGAFRLSAGGVPRCKPTQAAAGRLITQVSFPRVGAREWQITSGVLRIAAMRRAYARTAE